MKACINLLRVPIPRLRSSPYRRTAPVLGVTSGLLDNDFCTPSPAKAYAMSDHDNMAPGLETLDYSFPGTRPAGAFAPVLVGVVGSGNLEVLLEPAPGSDCRVRIETSARGFGAIWQAVAQDFHQRHGLGGVQVSVHDMGATPAVVSLRLDQAVSELQGARA